MIKQLFPALFLIAVLLGGCSPAIPATPSASFTDTYSLTAPPPTLQTPQPEALSPGDSIGTILLSAGYDENVQEIWEFCDPNLPEPGDSIIECSITPGNYFIGLGILAENVEKMNEVWASDAWQLFIDDRAIDLEVFGTIDHPRDQGILRRWNISLEGLQPGVHTITYIYSDGVDTWNVTWNLVVEQAVQLELPEGVGDLPFTDATASFATVDQFMALLNAAVTTGEMDAFWDDVLGTGQMPLIFGDRLAIFLYRGLAEKVSCLGDVNEQYLPLGGRSLWGFARIFEPDARIEYLVKPEPGEAMLDPLNSLIETGGPEPFSVLQMPGYEVPIFTEAIEGMPPGFLEDNIHISSDILGYDVVIRVYTPLGYGDLADLPVIYVTNGPEYLNSEQVGMKNALDNLIATGQIRPLMAVFIDPRDPISGEDRQEIELAPSSLENCKFCDFLALELVPRIDSAYKTDPSPSARMILGFSLGGNFSAVMGLAYPDVFGLLGIQSPTITWEWVTADYQFRSRLPLQMFVSRGTYDPEETSRKLVSILEEKDYPHLFVETPSGRSYATVRGLLDDLLLYFFGR